VDLDKLSISVTAQFPQGCLPDQRAQVLGNVHSGHFLDAFERGVQARFPANAGDTYTAYPIYLREFVRADNFTMPLVKKFGADPRPEKKKKEWWE